jgi:starch phosphorylase
VRKVQIIVAGKAHPRDETGKHLVEEWVRFVRRDDLRTSAVFLADYDLRIAEQLVQGVDLWINTPRPPWEACGTSGMKVLVNGGVNLSTRDGWWAEAYQPELGWLLEGDGSDDAGDAALLYELLEREVIPSFYERDPLGVPRRWVARMRASMSGLTPVYSANRALREYAEHYYAPAARACARRCESGAELAARIIEWERMLRTHWPLLRFGEVRVTDSEGRHCFETSVYLDDIDPEWVTIELYADGENGAAPVRTAMRRERPLVGAHGFIYLAEVPDTRPAAHYTARAIARHPDALVPLEAPMILWAG